MYKVHLMTTGKVQTAACHELVKGLPDEDFQDLYHAFQIQPRRTETAPVDMFQDDSLSESEFEMPEGAQLFQ